MKALRAAERGSHRHPQLFPLLSPASQQLPSSLISSPRHPAGEQGQTKASLLTAPPRKGLFFSACFSIQAPLPPPGPGPWAH